VPEIVTGKPLLLGGIVGRQSATGLGAVYCIESVLQHIGWTVRGQRVVIQGFGNVGAVIARELSERGAIVVGVSDVTGGIASEMGLDVDSLITWVGEHRFLRGFPGGEPVTRELVVEIPCDILVPAALERQITADNAARLDCRLIVEAANGPTTPEADRILAERGIPVVPDVIANAGGVTSSYFEWAQDQQKYLWDSDEIASRLHTQLHNGIERVFSAAGRYDIDWRTAAQTVAIERFAAAARLRAIYP
jgi:glutamate dehydrogenase (NAD(P)+)